MVIIEKPGKPTKYFAEIDDFPYAKTSLSLDAYDDLKAHLEQKLKNYYKQQRFIAMLMSKQDKKAA